MNTSMDGAPLCRRRTSRISENCRPLIRPVEIDWDRTTVSADTIDWVGLSQAFLPGIRKRFQMPACSLPQRPGRSAPPTLLTIVDEVIERCLRAHRCSPWCARRCVEGAQSGADGSALTSSAKAFVGGRWRLGSGFNAPPMTYSVNGKQIIAVASRVAW